MLAKDGSRCDSYNLARTERHKMAFLADTLAAQLNARSAERMKCYNCGEPGHVQRDCKKPKQANKNACAIPAPPSPWCRRGQHWARECQSKLPVAAWPCNLLGNGKKSARPRTIRTNTVLNRSANAWPAHSDQPLPAAQECIWPPPSQ
uniref:CCHC-type domain-containing protein n=1 Tax=Gallus gallus TaxID=9031 RepID=A0A8V0YEX7_CHICK